mmetsp:Transcript_128210/g.191069  ORF Transcript_128210/g.191069 Transcript_128210/m.191069 type:complete len:102 (-) Transcript_128210:862-1167(-)|eukprot:CAMPEP_0117002244 /NCGR_PEP_ID=MMETSP0472-20121206/3987_1 /TAXON_ID=693140 ORGANISM="Tiarina fusus, Strain LIS" /NCGR_SAMPLE_ID=MMETSP0472 /ASSEMBLY_ACC=CAM_ASM_000603 /LENGTH=101 /DNA_ID=CAMNT_0004702545 /DNA_START=119 /DNA_END=424 /DNA_ORIENTATION=-
MGLQRQNQPPPRWVRLVQIYAVKLVLEVFGSTGAVWGFSEVVGLRTSETAGLWRTIAMSVGYVFFVRFLLQIKDSVQGNDEDEDMLSMKELRTSETSPLVG